MEQEAGLIQAKYTRFIKPCLTHVSPSAPTVPHSPALPFTEILSPTCVYALNKDEIYLD